MNTFRTSAEITSDHQIVLTLPAEMPVGTAEVVVTVSSSNGNSATQGSLQKRFGTVRSGDARGADNDRIDADLTNADRRSQG